MSIRGRRVALLAAAVGLGVLAFAGAPVQARQARLFAGTFGAATSTTPNPYPLAGATELSHSLAADSTAGPSRGNVYVTDTANHRVEKFDSSGHFLLMFGSDVNRTAVETPGRESEQNVCPALGHPGDVCQSGGEAAGPGALKRPALIAVDNSSGPSQGDVYVDTGSGLEAHNEVQLVKLSKSVTGGTFTLSFKGATTAPIPYLATPRQVAEALEALATVGPGNVAVEYAVEAVSFPSQWTVEFTKVLGAEDVSQMSVNPGGLTPGGTTASVSTTVNGNSLMPDLVTKFDSEGQLVSGWAAGGQLDGSVDPFPGNLVGIAVDPAGNLWVLGPSSPRAFEFNQEAKSIAGWTGSDGHGTINAGLTLDPEDNLYYLEKERGLLLKFNAAGTRLGSVVDSGSEALHHEVESYAVDPTRDHLFVAVETRVGNEPGGATEVQRYFGPSCHPSGNNNPCTPVESFGHGRLEYDAPGIEVRSGPYRGLAVDPSSPADPVYVLGGGSGQVTAFAVENVPGVTTVKASGFTTGSAILNGTVNPSGAPLTGCFFEWGETVAYGHRVECEPSAVAIGSGGSAVSVHAQVAVQAGKTYHFRLVAGNAASDLAEEPSQGEDFVFGPPVVERASAFGVSATSVILQDELNANNLKTRYRFEYDTLSYVEGEGSHGVSVPVPDAGIGSGSVNVLRSEQIVGLAPGTAYYYRVVATNVLGVTDGPAGSFTTQSAVSGSSLLDGRVWEMVSPPQKSGAGILGIDETPGGVLQASASGDGLAYIANGSFGQEAPGNRSSQRSQFLAFRRPDGWSTKDVTTPREDVVGVLAGNTEGYKAFSRDLSLGAVQPRGFTPLSPLATETTPYLRAANGEFLPLVDPLDVPPETVFDGKVDSQGRITHEPQIEGGSPDLHSVVIASCFKLTEDAVNLCSKAYQQSLYVWHEGALRLASILPNEQPATAVSKLGGATKIGVTRHTVSEDGTRLVFSVFSASETLYLRDMTLSKTVRLDLPEPGAAGGAEDAQFKDMSADGSKVFFTDTARLTKNATSDSTHPDLYMCEVLVEGEDLACALKDLSVARNTGEAGAVLGSMIGADASGRYVYFVANGALASGTAPGDCNGDAETGSCGLYLYDTVAGTVKLVTMLSGADVHDWNGEQIEALTARVSPNGRFLAFMSQRNLTGYDNRDAVSGRLDQEVFLYDRLGNGGEGKLVCASCNPTGARPHGVEIVDNAHSLLNEEDIWSGGTWLATAIPGWTPFSLSETFYQSRYLSDSGRLFFNSADALVPRDSNGTTDVYEYEPPQGEGQPASNSCSVSSSTYSPVSGGCVNLVSSGSSPEESAFLDASESGDDVFFLTASQLAAGDVDSANDIYDARVGGSVSEMVRPPACEGDACQNPVSAPEDPTPGSLTFQGPGNPLPSAPVSVKGKIKPVGRAEKLARALKACAGKPKRKRAVCERRARRSYGPVGKAKKSNRGTHR